LPKRSILPQQLS